MYTIQAQNAANAFQESNVLTADVRQHLRISSDAFVVQSTLLEEKKYVIIQPEKISINICTHD